VSEFTFSIDNGDMTYSVLKVPLNPNEPLIMVVVVYYTDTVRMFVVLLCMCVVYCRGILLRGTWDSVGLRAGRFVIQSR